VSYSPIDPASLSGDALDDWYGRSPDQVAADRQAAAAARYNDFFGLGALAGSLEESADGDQPSVSDVPFQPTIGPEGSLGPGESGDQAEYSLGDPGSVQTLPDAIQPRSSPGLGV